MTQDRLTQDAAKAKTSPTRVFARPQDVLLANDLTVSEKRQVLAEWKEEAIALQVATNENMAGGEHARLDEVVAALAALDKL